MSLFDGVHRRLLFVALLVAGCSADGNDGNQPPELEIDVPSELTYTVGDDVIRITLTAEDPEGGEVRFEVVDGPDRGELQSSTSNWAIFTWDPLAPDVTPADEPRSLVFAAIDPQGARSEKVVRVRIQAGNGIPRFENSASILHTIGSGKPVAFDVTVRDDDSDSLNLRMPPGFAPAGAEFTSTGPKSGRFGWQPQAGQLEQRVHSVKFIADDGVNDPVEQDVTIILKKESSNVVDPPEPSDCFFEDRVSYTAIDPQRGTEDVTVEARFEALNGDQYDKLILNYSNADPFNDFEVEWQSSEMTESEGVFTAQIPNPLLETGSDEYYFEICAINEDAAPEDTRKILCGPTSLYESFIFYAPNSEECIDDAGFGNSFDNAETHDEQRFIYRRLCKADEDYFEFPLGTEQETFVYLVYPANARPTVEVFNADESPAQAVIEHSDCSGFTNVYVQNSGAPTKKFIRVTASNDSIDVPYQILFDTRDLGGEENCADASFEPNDDADDATEVTAASAQFAAMEICREDDVDVYAITAQAGEQIDAVATFTHSVGDLDMLLFSPSERDDVGRLGFGSDYSWSLNDNEEINYIAEESGTHYLAVYSEQGVNRYSLDINVDIPLPSCIDVGFNHMQSTADILPQGTTNGLKVCAGEEDWYSFQVLDITESFIIELTAEAEPMLQDFTIEVWDLFGKVSEGTMNNGKLRIDFFPFVTGTHWVKVTSSTDQNYTLDLTILFGA